MSAARFRALHARSRVTPAPPGAPISRDTPLDRGIRWQARWETPGSGGGGAERYAGQLSRWGAHSGMLFVEASGEALRFAAAGREEERGLLAKLHLGAELVGAGRRTDEEADALKRWCRRETARAALSGAVQDALLIAAHHGWDDFFEWEWAAQRAARSPLHGSPLGRSGRKTSGLGSPLAARHRGGAAPPAPALPGPCPVEVVAMRDCSAASPLGPGAGASPLALEAQALDVDGAESAGGRSALMIAAFEGHDGMVRALLARGASPNLRDAQRNTALLYALNARTVPHPRQAGVVRALLEGGASPAMANRQGASALALAAGLGLWRELALLLRHAEPPDAEDAAALEAAALRGRDLGESQAVAERFRLALAVLQGRELPRHAQALLEADGGWDEGAGDEENASPRVAEGRRGPEGAGRYAEERFEEDGEAGRAPRRGSGGVEEEGPAGGAGEVDEGYDEDEFEEGLGTGVSEVGVMSDIEVRYHPSARTPQRVGLSACRGREC